MKVLVVEDDDCLEVVVRKLIKGIDKRITMDWETSVDEAIKRLSALDNNIDELGYQYDLVIIDIFTPGRHNGLHLLQYMRTNFPLIPVVIMSSIDIQRLFTNLDRRGLEAPAFIHKPFSPNEFRTIVRSALTARS